MSYVGRFAPSPTGPLHLGSLATALASYLHARVNGGKWLVRIEDIDPERCKPEWSEEILQCLRAHGLFWDDEVVFQSKRIGAYEDALGLLEHKGLTYPCACTRRDIELANRNRPFGQNRVYPGTCKLGITGGKKPRAIRFRCPATPITWEDKILGSQSDDLQNTSGDFVLLRGDGHWAYHLAVVVDDIASGVTDIMRGVDLTDTTARQLALYDAIGAELPTHYHLPVILAADGQKLSKQTGAEPLNHATPVENLNRAWRHLGGVPIHESHPDSWLTATLSHFTQLSFVKKTQISNWRH